MAQGAHVPARRPRCCERLGRSAHPCRGGVAAGGTAARLLREVPPEGSWGRVGVGGGGAVCAVRGRAGATRSRPHERGWRADKRSTQRLVRRHRVSRNSTGTRVHIAPAVLGGRVKEECVCAHPCRSAPGVLQREGRALPAGCSAECERAPRAPSKATAPLTRIWGPHPAGIHGSCHGNAQGCAPGCPRARRGASAAHQRRPQRVQLLQQAVAPQLGEARTPASAPLPAQRCARLARPSSAPAWRHRGAAVSHVILRPRDGACKP